MAEPSNRSRANPPESDNSALVKELSVLYQQAQRTASLNQRLDIGFKVALLLLTIGATVCSVLIATKPEKPPTELTTINALLAGVSTVLSAFAFSQMNFAARQRIWQKKADAFASLKAELQFSQPERERLVARMNIARSWGDDTPPDAQLEP